MPAEAADSGELLRCLGGVLGREKKGGSMEDLWGLLKVRS
jgi:hypothetical protein